MPKPLRTGLLALSLLVAVPTYVSAAQSTPPAATEAAEPQVAVDEDDELGQGWVGLAPLLGAAAIMVTAIAVGVSFMRRRR